MTIKTIFKSATPHPQNSSVLNISCEELKTIKQNDNIALIDVRQPEEYIGELGHILNAELIPLDQLESLKAKHSDKNKSFIFICRSGGRSAQATAWAVSQGYESSFNLEGGMIKWNELKFETSNQGK